MTWKIWEEKWTISLQDKLNRKSAFRLLFLSSWGVKNPVHCSVALFLVVGDEYLMVVGKDLVTHRYLSYIRSIHILAESFLLSIFPWIPILELLNHPEHFERSLLYVDWLRNITLLTHFRYNFGANPLQAFCKSWLFHRCLSHSVHRARSRTSSHQKWAESLLKNCASLIFVLTAKTENIREGKNSQKNIHNPHIGGKKTIEKFYRNQQSLPKNHGKPQLVHSKLGSTRTKEKNYGKARWDWFTSRKADITNCCGCFFIYNLHWKSAARRPTSRLGLFSIPFYLRSGCSSKHGSGITSTNSIPTKTVKKSIRNRVRQILTS